MKLHPYPRRSERWRKVCKHVFDHAERWWEIYGDLPAWQRDWSTLRATGCFHLPEGHQAIAGHPAAESVADQHHDAWLAAAERAADQARAADEVYPNPEPDRVTYVGTGGVTVVVASGQHLVTCYRARWGGELIPLEEWTRRAVALARQKSGLFERAAVRRAARRASLGSGHARGVEDDDV